MFSDFRRGTRTGTSVIRPSSRSSCAHPRPEQQQQQQQQMSHACQPGHPAALRLYSRRARSCVINGLKAFSDSRPDVYHSPLKWNCETGKTALIRPTRAETTLTCAHNLYFCRLLIIIIIFCQRSRRRRRRHHRSVLFEARVYDLSPVSSRRLFLKERDATVRSHDESLSRKGRRSAAAKRP